MLGVEDYGSDNDSDHELSPNGAISSTQKAALPLKLPPPVKATQRLSPKPEKSKRAPKKITIELPTLPGEPEDDIDVEKRPAKKPRLQSGAGSSSLIGMLPAPKQKQPVVQPKERVLGAGRGPGLVFNNPQPTETYSMSISDNLGEEGSSNMVEPAESLDKVNSTLFRPTSLGKGRSNISIDEGAPSSRKVIPKVLPTPPTDFFSLDNTSVSSATSSKSQNPMPPVASVSSAPIVEDFTPPEPTPTDPYPGYYLLPSGSWAAYDPVYYQSFYKKWEKEYNAHVRALEKGTAKGFEELETMGSQEVDAMKEMEKAKKEIQEREEKKAVTRGAGDGPAAPRMNIKGAKLGNLARSRHQLSTLLTEAYQNRDALEEKIAEGRRNRKEAGNKYGF